MQIKYIKTNDELLVNIEDHFLSGSLQIIELNNKIESQLQNINKLIIDLAEVEMFSSSVLGVLISLSKKMREKNGSIIIRNSNKNIKDVFKTTCLEKYFEFENF
jgi:anti-sigma B factor antagonist